MLNSRVTVLHDAHDLNMDNENQKHCDTYRRHVLQRYKRSTNLEPHNENITDSLRR